MGSNLRRSKSSSWLMSSTFSKAEGSSCYKTTFVVATWSVSKFSLTLIGSCSALLDPDPRIDQKSKMDHWEAKDLENMKWTSNSSAIKGPKRMCKFCFLGIIIPIILLCIPLYMRYQALRPHRFTLSPSDMKLLNQVISLYSAQLSKSNDTVCFSGTRKIIEKSIIGNQ